MRFTIKYGMSKLKRVRNKVNNMHVRNGPKTDIKSKHLYFFIYIKNRLSSRALHQDFKITGSV